MARTLSRVALHWVPALVLATIGLLEIAGVEGWDRLALGLVVLGVTLPVGLRAHRPLVAYGFVVASISLIAIAFPAYESIAILFALVICTYSLAQREPAPLVIAGVTAGAAAVVAAIARDPTDDLTNILPTVLLFVVAPAGAGWALRRRNVRAEALLAEARAAAESERRRVARELHDVVAHAVTVMVIQAQAAQRLRLTDPAEELDALVAIEERGRRALVELRRLLGVLRTEGEADERAPQPGIAQISTLAEEMRDAGFDVALSVEGDVTAVPAGVDVSAYRIVQEALTNALRHGGSGGATVVVRADAEAVFIDVVNEGSRKHDAGGRGFGLTGMRERVRLLGGTLTAGPRDQGGFAVRVELPL